MPLYDVYLSRALKDLFVNGKVWKTCVTNGGWLRERARLSSIDFTMYFANANKNQLRASPPPNTFFCAILVSYINVGKYNFLEKQRDEKAV